MANITGDAILDGIFVDFFENGTDVKIMFVVIEDDTCL